MGDSSAPDFDEPAGAAADADGDVESDSPPRDISQYVQSFYSRKQEESLQLLGTEAEEAEEAEAAKEAEEAEEAEDAEEAPKKKKKKKDKEEDGARKEHVKIHVKAMLNAVAEGR